MPRRKNSDYESNDGFNTCIWGPSLWHVLHTISFNYKNTPTLTEKVQYYQFIRSLGDVLPCKSCRDNFRSNLVQTGLALTNDPVEIVKLPQLKNRHTFSKFIYDLHLEVCNMKDVDELPCSYYAMRETYETFRAKCTPKTDTYHGGCEAPITYVPSKAVIRIIPKKDNEAIPTFSVDGGCQTLVAKKRKGTGSKA
jgi:hypothetical protein